MGSELHIDDSFERSYEIERLLEMPNSPSIGRHYLPPGVQNGGPILRVTPSRGDKFLIMIAGDPERVAVATWPKRESFLARPGGWLVSTVEPSASRQLPGFDGHTVHYIFSVPDRNLVLIGHCCAIYCYNSEGMVWAQEDLFCCDDPLLDLAGDVLLLTAVKHTDGNTPTLKRVNMITGERLP